MVKCGEKKAKKLIASTKNDFIKTLKENACGVALTNDQAKEVYETFTKILRDTVVAEEKLVLNGFGTFKLRKLAARKGINPRTKKPIQIKASKTIGFKPTGSFKETL